MEQKTKVKQSDWLQRKKAAAEQAFSKLPSPHLRYGTTVMMDISSLNLQAIDPKSVEWIIKAPTEVTMVSFEQADQHILTDHLSSIFQKDKDKLTALHMARVQDTLLITIPNNIHSEIKITANSKTDSIQHIIIIAEEHSSAHITYTTAAEAFLSSAIELFAKKNADIQVTRIHRGKSWSFDYKIAKIGQSGSVKWVDIYTDCAFLRSETTSILQGKESSASIKTLFMGKGSDQIDIEVSAMHNAPNTTSDIRAKGALKGSSKNIYRGLIHMAANAENSIGKQKEDVLILSDQAEADSIPKLIIDNNNIKCTHAASIGHIDPEKLFYLQSRGLSEASARQTIVDGFFEPIKKQLNTEVMIQ